ncbi:2OG-Fe(II) oxygenase [Paraglaciecola aestuariivivens]
MQHFIVEFKNALSADFCASLIKKFESDPNITQGRMGSGVDVNKKDSLDLYLSTLPHWQQEQQAIVDTMLKALVQYVRAYPHMLIGALSPSILHPKTQQPHVLTIEDIPQLNDEYLAGIIHSIFDIDAINMQKYKKGQGNFKHWHSEHFPHPSDKQQKSLHRTLLWLIYLNDVEEGGETEFLYQQAKIKPTTGSIILSPCGFTHTHRGVVPKSNDKYVLASWIMFRPAAQLYGQ